MNKTLERLWGMKPKKFKDETDSSDLVNIYLEEFFNTTVQEEIEKDIYTKDERGEFTNESRNLFFKTFSVTQEQFDWWEEEVKGLLLNKSRTSKYRIEKDMAWIKLDIGPSIKK